LSQTKSAEIVVIVPRKHMSERPSPAIPASWQSSGGNFDELDGLHPFDDHVPAAQENPPTSDSRNGLDTGSVLSGGDDVEGLVATAAAFEAGMVADAIKASALLRDVAAGSGARVAMLGQELKVSQLEKCVEAGDVDLRSGIGQKFAAFLKGNKEENEKYKNLKTAGQTMALKKDFRKKWAECELEGLTVIKKSKLEEYQLIEEEIGTYEPLEMIVKYEGGHQSANAWRAAFAYARKAQLLGGSWLSYNSFTERVDILYVKKTKRTVFNRVWSLYQESIQNSDAVEKLEDQTEAAEVAPPGLETPLKMRAAAVEAPAAKRSAKAGAVCGASKVAGVAALKRGAADTGAGGEEPGSGKKPKKETSGADKDNLKAIRNAAATKILYFKVCTMHTSRMAALQTDPDWIDLATPSTIARLRKLFCDMSEAAHKDFASDFLNNELADVKAKYKTDMNEFFFNVKQFETTVAPMVKSLEAEQSRLSRMHLAGKAIVL
jgi:hypothetical protein